MAITIKQLANGQLPSSIGDLYESPASTQTIIKAITIVNTNTTTETVNLYVLKASGTPRRISPKDLALAAGYMTVIDDEITLEAGDKIQADTTTASKVDYVISGVQNS
jgi:hypothetical protein